MESRDVLCKLHRLRRNWLYDVYQKKLMVIARLRVLVTT